MRLTAVNALSVHVLAILWRGAILVAALVGSALQPSIASEPEATDGASSRRWLQAEPLSFKQLDSSSDLSASSGSRHATLDLTSRQPLGAREIACLAACQWHPAIGLRQRAQTIHQLYCNETQSLRDAANVVVCFLQLQAANQEDIGAASAMRAYYGRIGIKEQQSQVDLGMEAVELQESKQERLMDLGLAAGLDLSSLQREWLGLVDQRLQFDSQERQLRELLFNLTGMDYDMEKRDVEPLIIQPGELDCDQLVAEALCNRYDLQAWRILYCNINETSAPLIAEILSSAFGSFGLPIPVATCLKRLLHLGADPAALASTLRRELAVLIRAQEDYVRQSVQEKCEELRLAYSRHSISVQLTESWSGRLEQLNRLDLLGQAKAEERGQAEAGLLESRAVEVSRRLEAKLAEIALAEAVGGLAVRCCRGQAWLTLGN